MNTATKPQTTARPEGRPGCWRRNRKWLLLGFVLGGILAALLHYDRNYGRLMRSPPFRLAMEALRNNAQVAEALGKPIDDRTWFPAGRVDIEGDRGDAMLRFAVAGPLRPAEVTVQARLIEGEWGLTQLEVTPADGQRIDVLRQMQRQPADMEPVRQQDQTPPAEVEYQPATPDLNIELPLPALPPERVIDP